MQDMKQRHSYDQSLETAYLLFVLIVFPYL